ncbi:DUF3168 domain-containing protein [Pseudomonas sp. RIT-PI-AD]|uniref:DUF3168 domain-containing protein n=1 Tax=Pseudomonas sp. RIT-PI-AD TaxID=3035294 RepID=UPI0021D8D720|nr:DUF3168 domain-containing protein [Pseudomonas sp. RIT-PI-AD]
MIESDIEELLTGAAPVVAQVGPRIHAFPAPAGTVLPYITYQIVSSTRPATLAANGSLRNLRLQVSCWADSHPAAREVGEAVLSALDGERGLLFKAEEAVYDKDTQTSRMALEFSVWQ